MVNVKLILYFNDILIINMVTETGITVEMYIRVCVNGKTHIKADDLLSIQ